MNRKYLRQWLLTISILLLLGMVTAYDVYMDRLKTESVEKDRLLVQARVIDENLNHQLVATYEALQRIVSDLTYWRVGNSYKPVANLMLKTIEEAMPGVRTLLILDARGIARASSRSELIGQDFRQREYFQIVRRHLDPVTLHLSPPYTTVLNVSTMPVSCMVPGPNGEFNGIIVATLDPEYFKTLLASVLYAPDMWVAIAHGDGIQFLMVPDREGQSGKNLAQSGSFFSRHRDSGRDESIISGKVYATGEERMMALRTIHPAGAHLDKPLVVAVGRDLHALFTGWRRTAMIYGSAYLGVVLITVFSLRYNQISVHRAEAERLASETKFREIFNKSIDAIGVSRVGIHEFVNPAYAALFGYASGDELVGKSVLELIAPGERATIQDRIRRRAKGEAVPMVYETRGLRKDGSEFVMDVHASVYELFGETYTLVIMRDITERTRAEEALKRSKADLSDAQALSHIGSWRLVFGDGEEEWFASDELHRIYGYPPDMRITMQTGVDRMHPDDRERALEAWSAALQGDGPCEWEHRIVVNGQVKWLHVHVRFVCDATGKPVEAAGTVQDISDNKRAEEEREELITELQKVLAEIKTLHGILPICSSCKKIRDDKGSWRQLEEYISEHTDSTFSHGLCSDCAKKLYPKYYNGES